MIKKYEDACRKAGLSEEKIKEIRRLFDAEKKRFKREKEKKAQNMIWVYSICDLQKIFDDFEWAVQEDLNVEEIVVQNSLLEQLNYE